MTAAEVRDLVHAQVAGQWNRTNHHKVSLRECLLEPPRLVSMVEVTTESDVEVWLVLLENPKASLGYAVVYDERSGQFGLAQFTAGYEPCLIGIYGDFFDALEAM
jgi:hypothetical protein